MRTSVTKFTEKAKLVKKNDNAEVYDLATESLVLSMTVLYQGKSTTGHDHDETEEIYLFVEGKGEICLGEEKQEVVSGDIVTIPRGIFHRVFNTGDSSLTFLCFFKKYLGRG